MVLIMLFCSGDKEVSGISYRHKDKLAILASQSVAVLALQKNGGVKISEKMTVTEDTLG